MTNPFESPSVEKPGAPEASYEMRKAELKPDVRAFSDTLQAQVDDTYAKHGISSYEELIQKAEQGTLTMKMDEFRKLKKLILKLKQIHETGEKYRFQEIYRGPSMPWDVTGDTLYTWKDLRTQEFDRFAFYRNGDTKVYSGPCVNWSYSDGHLFVMEKNVDGTKSILKDGVAVFAIDWPCDEFRISDGVLYTSSKERDGTSSIKRGSETLYSGTFNRWAISDGQLYVSQTIPLRSAPIGATQTIYRVVNDTTLDALDNVDKYCTWKTSGGHYYIDTLNVDDTFSILRDGKDEIYRAPRHEGYQAEWRISGGHLYIKRDNGDDTDSILRLEEDDETGAL